MKNTQEPKYITRYWANVKLKLQFSYNPVFYLTNIN